MGEGRHGWVFWGGLSIAVCFWIVAFVLQQVARSRLETRPELSGTFRLREARKIQLLAALALLGLMAPWVCVLTL
jgi:hypothetical protein